MNRREINDRRREEHRKQGDGCPECGGRMWLPSGWLPHSPTCKRGQDEEAKALRKIDAPFCYIRWPDGPSALSDMVKERPDWSRRKS